MQTADPSDVGRQSAGNMAKLRVLGLFSGMGGFELGLQQAGFEIAAVCEIAADCHPILARAFPDARIYHDVRDLSVARLRADGVGRIDGLCGGFPCQDASIANVNGVGTVGARTGLYVHAVRLAGELGCRFVLLENVPELLNRGFGDVLGALAEIGFDAEWEVISAREAGADHERERLWIVAYPCGEGRQGLEPDNSILVAARSALAVHGHAAFDTWRALVGGELVLRSVDGLSVGRERGRLQRIGNAVTPVIPRAIGEAILAREAA